MIPAERDTAAVKARLERIYGRVPAVVYLAQTEPGGPVRIGRALRIGAAIRTLYRESDDVEILAVVPGSQPLQHWFRKRYRASCVDSFADGAVLARTDARMVGDTHQWAYAAMRDLGTVADPIERTQMAGVAAVRAHDVFLADLERLYRGGATHAAMADLAGLSEGQLRSTLDCMRALGFDLPRRRSYGSRSPRFEAPTRPSRTRLIG